MLQEMVTHRREKIAEYRDKSFTSKFTGTKSPFHHTPFMEEYDDSMENVLGCSSKS